MKIGITGTHNVGKTSLAHSLVGTLKEMGVHAVVNSEQVRNCPLPTGTEQSNSVDAQTWILGKQFIEEIELESKYPVVVCDRTVLCNYAYFLWNLQKSKGLEASPKAKIIHNLVDNWISTYDFIFKLPISRQTKLANDGFRSMAKDWQSEIDELIDKIIAEKNIKVYTIPMDTNERRVKKVLEIIQSKLKLNNQSF